MPSGGTNISVKI